jgi:hypothetical protein
VEQTAGKKIEVVSAPGIVASSAAMSAPTKVTGLSSFDGRWMTPAVEIAFKVLKENAPGAAFDGEPFMGTSLVERSTLNLVVCSGFYHTVTFFESRGKAYAAVYTREEGGMVPWVQNEGGAAPDSRYLDTLVRLPNVVFSDLWATTQAHIEAVAAAEHAERVEMPKG